MHMNKKHLGLSTMLLVLLLILLSACGGGSSATPANEPEAEAEVVEEETEAEAEMEEEEEEMAGDMAACDELTPVRLQLQWVTQSQFAGYYAALSEGFYEDHCLDVTILEGAVEIVPQQVVAAGDAEFGISWVPRMLASREQGADLVNIAQVFQRSGTLQVSWADTGITSPEDWAGKRVGTWGFGNEFELFAALRQAGIEPDNPDDVTIVQQPFDMALLLNREVDAAQAMTYNEYAQVLEAINPETGELYQPEDLNVINYEDVGTAMLQDHVFSTESYLADNEETAIAFLTASFEGWIFCRDNFDACVNHVLDNGPVLGEGHMQWQLNEINDLIWPSPNGIGVMDQAAWDQTIDISVEFSVLEGPPTDGAFRTDLAEAALANIDGDTTGNGFTKFNITLTEGGEAPGVITEGAAMADDDMMADAADTKVCQITDVGGIDDKSFNATAWLGVEKSIEQFGVEGKFLESQQQTDYEKNIQAFIDDGCDLIVTVGFLLGDATAAAAEANPDQDFMILDFAYDPPFDNVQGVVFASNQNAFLAGYAAASTTASGIVGTYGGVNIPPVTDFMDGYVLGVDYYNEQNGTDIQVLGWDLEDQDGLFTGNFESTDDGRAFAESLMDEGADVIFPLAGAANIGTASAVSERGGAWVIGVDSDFAAVLPEFADVIFMSTLKRLDTAVISATEEKLNGSFAGGTWVGTLANDGVGITEPTIDIPGLEEVRQAIIAGDIVTTPNAAAMPAESEDEGDDMMMAGDIACEVDLSGETILIHQQAGREGPLAGLLGEGFAFATDDALGWINDNGGICGAELDIVFTETNYNTDLEVQAFEAYAASDPKPFLVYTYASGATVALKDRVVEEQIVNFAAGLNGPAMYDPANGYTIGFAPIYSDQFAGYIEYLADNWDDLKPEGAGDAPVVGVIGWANAFGAGATTPEALDYVESIGVTVLPLEEIALDPSADASGQVQNLLLSGANVIWNQSLSFTPAQVIGAVRSLGVWDQVLVSGINWAMHNDVPNYMGDNAALLDGYCGPHPYATWGDTDIPGVALAIELFEAAGRPESEKSTTYLTTFGQFMATRDALIHAVNATGSAEITGADFLQALIDNEVPGMGMVNLQVDAVQRAPRVIQVGCWSADDAGNLSFDIVSGQIDTPDTAPYPDQ